MLVDLLIVVVFFGSFCLGVVVNFERASGPQERWVLFRMVLARYLFRFESVADYPFIGDFAILLAPQNRINIHRHWMRHRLPRNEIIDQLRLWFCVQLIGLPILRRLQLRRTLGVLVPIFVVIVLVECHAIGPMVYQLLLKIVLVYPIMCHELHSQLTGFIIQVVMDGVADFVVHFLCLGQVLADRSYGIILVV